VESEESSSDDEEEDENMGEAEVPPRPTDSAISGLTLKTEMPHGALGMGTGLTPAMGEQTLDSPELFERNAARVAATTSTRSSHVGKAPKLSHLPWSEWREMIGASPEVFLAKAMQWTDLDLYGRLEELRTNNKAAEGKRLVIKLCNELGMDQVLCHH